MKAVILAAVIAVIYFNWNVVNATLFTPDRIESSYHSVKWYKGSSKYNDALQQSKQSKAGHLIYFFTDWCPYCKQLKKQILSSDITKQGLAALVKSRINPEYDKQAKKIARNFDVIGYPTIYIKYPDMEQYVRLKFSLKENVILVNEPGLLGKEKYKPMTPENFVRAVTAIGL